MDQKKLITDEESVESDEESLTSDELELNLKKNSKLETLDISNCGLHKVPNYVYYFTYLIDLNLSKNCLKNLPRAIMYLNNLLYLNLSNNELSSLPKSLKQVQQLIYLNISNNKFVKVPRVIYNGLRNIQILDMSFNDINKFLDPPDCLYKIKELRLSHNSFKSLPNWIFDHRCQLQVLDVGDNSLSSKTNPNLSYYNSGIFISLKVLNMQNCNCSCENLEFLSYFKNLETLILGEKGTIKKDENFLGNFEINIFKHLSKLKKLILDNAMISILPSDVDCIKDVEILSAVENSISWVPENFGIFKNLKILDLSSNHLFFLPKNINELVSLQQIHLKNNNLDRLPASFKNLINLEYVDIFNNELEELDMNLFVFLINMKGFDVDLNFLDFEKLNTEKYNSLKTVLRTKFNYLDRANRQKLKESLSDSQSIGNSLTESEICNENFDIRIEEENWDAEENAEVENHPVEEENWDEENWDEEVKECDEDEFDPTEDGSARNFVAPLQPNFSCNYCPANTHAPSVLEIYMENLKSVSKSAPVKEGQFDSD